MTQVFETLWYNHNPYRSYHRCSFCSEQFNPGEFIVPVCEKDHLFHPACVEILYENCIRKNAADYTDECVRCWVESKHKEAEKDRKDQDEERKQN